MDGKWKGKGGREERTKIMQLWKNFGGAYRRMKGEKKEWNRHLILCWGKGKSGPGKKRRVKKVVVGGGKR